MSGRNVEKVALLECIVKPSSPSALRQLPLRLFLCNSCCARDILTSPNLDFGNVVGFPVSESHLIWRFAISIVMDSVRKVRMLALFVNTNAGQRLKR
jgi:hypothetical protein